MRTKYFRRERSAWKAGVAGMVSGLAATVVMTGFQSVWNRASEELNPKPRSEPSSQSEEEKEDATMKAAGKVAELAGQRLSHQDKKKAGPLVHFGFGTAMGAVYGLTHEAAPRELQKLDPVSSGTGYGTALFLAADEAALPALGLAGKPSKTPISTHIYGLASHLVYGVVAAFLFKEVRSRL